MKLDDPTAPLVKAPTEIPTVNVQHHADSFSDFALACSRIAGDARKLEKIRFVAEYLRCLSAEVIPLAVTWFSGRPFPASQNRILQVGWAVLREVAGMDEARFEKACVGRSDAGEITFELLRLHEPKQTLSVQHVNQLFLDLHAARGPLAKTRILTDALKKGAALEGKYLVKIITGDLRIGLKEGLVEEAIAVAFEQLPEQVRQANLLLGDPGETAKLAAQNRLGEATLVPFRPVKFMLASPEPTAAAVWERCSRPPAFKGGECEEEHVKSPSPILWLEDKYDGVRCQLHKVGSRVALYSRDLKEVTLTFLELADEVRKMTADFLLDGEVLAMRGDEVLPFGELQKRLGRREGDLFLQHEVPVKFMAFDLLWLNGESYLGRPLGERRQALESLCSRFIASPPLSRLSVARITQAESVEQIESAFDAARARGNEGLMIKDPGSLYTPGRRGLAWLKLKKAFATLDCVVVGVEYGHGKRNNVLSDYTFAVRDENTGHLETIGKAYSGLTDAEIAELTQHFLKKVVRQDRRYFEVEPDTVLEIAFDKIQPSNRHSSGLALRFPRIQRIRADKPVSEIDTLASARKLAGI